MRHNAYLSNLQIRIRKHRDDTYQHLLASSGAASIVDPKIIDNFDMLDDFRVGVRVLKQIERVGKRMGVAHGRREARAKKMLGKLVGLDRKLDECNEGILEVHCRIYEPGEMLDEIVRLEEVDSAGQGCVVWCGVEKGREAHCLRWLSE